MFDTMTDELREKLNNLPTRPGVYQHKDSEGNVLYVGKAKNLRSRVRSYFQEAKPADGRLRIMIRKINDTEVIVTDTEAEALILENNLIKKLKPRYNINLRDDKSYPFICIKNERFPRVFPTRRVRKDGSKYFGPYTDVKNMRLMLRTIRSIFMLRTCNLNLTQSAIDAGKYQPCLEYHIKKCAAPCVGLQSEADYNQTIMQIEKLLNGHTKELIGLLRDEMKRLASEMKFEEAASLRDRIAALEKYSARQRIVSQDFEDRDVFALAVDREESVACGVLFKVREGTVIGRQHKYIRRIEGLTDESLLQSLLEYHIKKCAAPCVGLQSEEDYNQTIMQIEKLLNGHTKELIGLLRDEMKRLASEMKFEEAASLRDRIAALEKYSARQRIVSQDFEDRDVFALAVDREESVACGVLFKVREGTVIGRQHKYIRRIEGLTDESLLQSLLESYYTETTFFPEEVLLSHDIPDPEPLEEVLRRGRGKKVGVRMPQRGDKAGLVRMVETNANLLLDEWKLQKEKRGEDRIPFAVKKLHKDLRLDDLPRRMECFDISHLSGTGTVASCVVFQDGKPRKSDYRHYKIRSAEGKPDDYLSMREVISRRYKRILADDGPWPDLVVIDGGKGQLSSAVEALREVGAYGRFPVIGLAKRLEEVFFPGDSESMLIAKDSASLQLLQRLRNEAHRFAISFQRTQRTKRTIRTELTEIPGIGPKVSARLIGTFGSVKQVREASEEQLSAVVGPARARAVKTYFEEQVENPA